MKNKVTKYWDSNSFLIPNKTLILLNNSKRKWITLLNNVKVNDVMRRYPTASDVMYMSGENYISYYTINKA